ncbi:MAG: serine hydrolase [bacterium]|nr:serine hydrolase [bacterium]
MLPARAGAQSTPEPTAAQRCHQTIGCYLTLNADQPDQTDTQPADQPDQTDTQPADQPDQTDTQPALVAGGTGVVSARDGGESRVGGWVGLEAKWPEGAISGAEFCLVAGAGWAGWPCDAVTHVCSMLLSPWCKQRLSFEVAQLGRDAAAGDPSMSVSLAVVLADGSLIGFNADVSVQSASAAKAYWAAVALDEVGADAAAAAAEAALVDSDNWAAGRLIDLAGGIDALNGWLWGAGLGETHLWQWDYGRQRLAASLPAGRTRGNRTTTADLARFYAALGHGTLLGTGAAQALADWLRQTPRPADTHQPHPWEAPLLTLLPPSAASGALHKAGWLPPGCCAHPWNLSIDAALIPLAHNNGWYAIAATAHHARNWKHALEWIADAADRVHALIDPRAH